MAEASLVKTPDIVRAKLAEADGEIRRLWDFAWTRRGKLAQFTRAEEAAFESAALLFREWDAFWRAEPSAYWGSSWDQAEAFRERGIRVYDELAAAGHRPPWTRPKLDERPSLAPTLGLGVAALAIVVVIVVLVKFS